MFYDKTTGQLIDGTPDEIQQKILSGEAVVKKGTKAVNIIDSEGDSAGSADLKNLPELFKQGYRIETPTEKVANDYVDENKGFVGGAKVFARELGDSALLNIPGLIANKYEDSLENAKYKALKKEHDAYSLAGNIVGTGSTFLNPVGIAGKLAVPASQAFKAANVAGNAVEKYVATKIATSAAPQIAKELAPKIVGMGVEGATIAAPTAITEAMLGDSDTAAEALLAGGALGGVLGASIGVGKVAFNKLGTLAKEKINDFPRLKEIHEDAALNAVGLSPSQKVNLRNDSGDVVDMLPQYVDDITKGDRNLLVKPKKLAEKIVQVENDAGQTIGNTIQQLDTRVNELALKSDDATKAILKEGMPNATEIANKIEEKFIKPYEGDPLYTTQVNKAKAVVNSLDNFVQKDLGGDPQAFNLAAWRKKQLEISKLVSDTQYGSEQAVGIEAVKFLRNEISSYFKNLSPKIKEVFPDLGVLADNFKKANDTYRVSETIREMAQKYGAKVDGKQMLGLLDTTAATTGAILTGNIGGAIAGIGAKKLYNYGRKWYDVGGLLLTEQNIASVAKKLDAIPEALKNIALPARATAISKISSITGNKDDDNYDKLSEKLQDFVANPQNSPLMKTYTGLGDTGAPTIASSAMVKSTNAAQYLLGLMPKPLTPNNPLVKNIKYKPSDMEMTKFTRQVKTALDPISVIDDLADGTVTKDQVQVLADLYPKLFQEMKYRVINAVMENPSQVPYNKRIKLSLVLGQDLDPSLKPSTSAIIMATSPAQEPQQPQGGNPNANFTVSFSENQRIQNDLK